MSFESFMVHDLTIVRPGTTTGRGSDVVADWANTVETATTGWFNQTATADLDATRAGQESDWLLSLRSSTDIRKGDRVEWDGFTLEVVGHPWKVYAKTVFHHIEVQLKVVEG